MQNKNIKPTFLVHKYEIDIDVNSPHFNAVVFDTAFTFAPQSLRLKFIKRY
jgi:hypothetical protein